MSTIGNLEFANDYPNLFALRKIPPALLTAAFLDQKPLKAMWLAGTHKSVQVKPDSKVISGKDLAYALDPFGDTTYLAAAVRSDTTGVSLKGSGVWTKPYASMQGFAQGVLDILKNLENNSGKTATLPILANELHSFKGVRSAFDFEVAPLEILSSSVDRRLAEKLNNSVEFKLLSHSKNNEGIFKLQIVEKSAPTQKGDFIITPAFSSGNAEDLQFSVSSKTGSLTNPHIDFAIQSLCSNPCIFRVFYETGHTISVGHLALSTPKDRSFTNWKWCNFQALRGIDVSKEKPDGNDLTSIWTSSTEDSLFTWFISTISDKAQSALIGLKPLSLKSDVWVFCDDDSGEVADFVHIYAPKKGAPEICLVHAKGARSTSIDREMVAGPFEVVCSQASKNVRYIDSNNLLNRIKDRIHDVKRPLWNSPNLMGVTPDGNRGNFEKLLKNIGANAKYQILIIQPQVTNKAYIHPKNAAGTIGGYVGAIQLRSLLFATQNAARAAGADFHVMGCN